MKGKFSNPLGVGDIYITQTYHPGGNNTAIDLYGASYKTNMPIYAIADGVISTTSSASGSYCILDVDNSNLNVFYVHTWHWLRRGTKVKQGDKICEIAPYKVNGGFPEHLHLGLNIPYRIMNYFNRTLNFKTKYKDIMKEWFINGKINWSLFKDLSYLEYSMKYKKGDRFYFNNTMNFRNGDGEVKTVIAKGAVCENISDKLGNLPESAGEWDYYNVKFLNDTGYVADTDRNELTTKPITRIDGTIPVEPPEPVDCTKYEEQIEDLKKELELLEGELKEKEEVLVEMGIEIENLEQIIRDYQTSLKEITDY